MNKNIFTVTIGIPAYNEEKNIANVLTALVDQKEDGYILEQIVVYSDMSTDKTNEIVQSFKNKKVKLINGNKRSGKITGIKIMIGKITTDIIVLLDADVLISDELFICKIVNTFKENDNIGIVCAKRNPHSVRTFSEKCIYSSIRAYDHIANAVNQGNNPYNCHGSALALSYECAKAIDYPAGIFSDDTYLYFASIAAGFNFRYSPKAEYEIYLPNTLSDTIKQYKRFLDIDQMIIDRYRSLISAHYHVPKLVRIKYLLIELITDPIHSLAMYLIIQYCKLYRNISLNTSTWNIAATTKGVNNK